MPQLPIECPCEPDSVRTGTDDKLAAALDMAQRTTGVTAPVMPAGTFGDGVLLAKFVKAVEDFLASPLGQALEQALLKLLLGLAVA